MPNDLFLKESEPVELIISELDNAGFSRLLRAPVTGSGHFITYLYHHSQRGLTARFLAAHGRVHICVTAQVREVIANG